MTAEPEHQRSEPADQAQGLASPDVVRVLVSRLLWVLATQIANVAVAWLVYEETRSPLALGLVGLAAFAPRFLLTLASGIAADRYDRRLVMAASLGTSGAASLGLAAIATGESVSLVALYVLFIVTGVARGFAGPASQAMLASLVPRHQLGRAVGLSSSTSRLAAIAGPAVGGLLFTAGRPVPLACAALSFLVAAVLNLAVRQRPERLAKGPIALSDALAGLGFIWRRPVVLGAVSLDLFAVLLGGATALLPIVADELLHVGPVGLGFLRSMPAAGAMVMGLMLAHTSITHRVGVKLLVATAIFGLSTIGLGLSTSFYLSLALLWIMGAADMVGVVVRQTLVQADTPEQMRGRVAAVNALFIGASNELGEFESGVTAALFGLVPAILIGGVGTIAVSVLWVWLFPALARRDRLVEP